MGHKLKTLFVPIVILYLCSATIAEKVPCRPDVKSQCVIPLDSICLPSPTDPSDYRCQCLKGFYEFDNKCTLKPRPCKSGPQCSENEACIANSTGMPVCTYCGDMGLPNYSQSKCLVYATKIDDTCEIPEQCFTTLGNGNALLTICQPFNLTLKKCRCNAENAVASIDQTKCHPIIDWGDQCVDDAQCLEFENAKCISEEPVKKCKCDSGYIESNEIVESYKCYEIAEEIGDNCEVTQQCKVVNSQCDKGTTNTCICPSPTFVQLNNKCLKVASGIGGPCEDSIQCGVLGDIDLTKCEINNDGVRGCYCNDLVSYPNGGKCLRYATSVGETCLETPQCKNLGPAQCNVTQDGGKQCTCNPNESVPSLDGSQCLTLSDWESPCVQDDQCTLISNNTECIPENEEPDSPKKCVCKDKFVRSENQTVGCVAIVEEQYGECSEVKQCQEGMGNLSNCTDGTCQCIPGSSYLNLEMEKNKCFRPSSLNNICSENGQCIVGTNSTFSECNDTTKRCICQVGVIEWDKSCYEEKKVGDSCTNLLQCTVPIKGEVVCDPREAKCTCKLGYTADFSKTACTSEAINSSRPIALLMVMSLLTKLFF